MARTVTIIPQKSNLPVSENFESEQPKRRVAAYARVSTDSEEQQTSYTAQVDYYTKYIKGRNDWEFISVYTDEGISATNTKHRDGFNRMISDALEGKIDLIITKSVSRFARNTVDSLTTVRKLKEKGIEVFFQKENIYTLDSKGELLITIMSSLAQEESRSISENVTWGRRKQMADGKFSVPYSHFLGYRCGDNGLPEIVPEEAKIIRFIYQSFISGKTPYRIAQILTEKGIPTPAGKEKWTSSTVSSILTNEKYKGSALLQKTVTVDFLTKKQKVNTGEAPQYYIDQSHPAIISPEEFEFVQAEIARRKLTKKYYHSKNPLANRIVCAECGEFYGSKVWHSNSEKYRHVIWQCNGKYRHGYGCCTPHLDETEIKKKFLQAYNQLFINRESILDACKTIQINLEDCSDIESQIFEIMPQMKMLADKVQFLIAINSRTAQKQERYKKEYKKLSDDYNKLDDQLKALQAEKVRRGEKGNIIRNFIREISERKELLVNFDEELWVATLDHVTVFADKSMAFEFKDGTKIEI